MHALGAEDRIGELTTPRFELIARALKRKDWETAADLAREARTENVWAHDGFRNAVARTLDVIYRTFGQGATEELGYAAMEDNFLAMQRMYDGMDIREQVQTAAAGWHWHMTRFRLTEDAEKVTFLLEPCGSGGRLINEGAYYGTGARPLTLMAQGSSATFGEDEFPIYCNHCSELTRIGLGIGAYGFLMEGWTKAHRYGACRQHAFKRLSAVPEEFYGRVGIDATRISERHSGDVGDRVFSEEELLEIATHPINRLEAAIADRDARRADEINAECVLGWGTVIHDVYRDWLTALYDQTLSRHGVDAFDQVMSASAWELFGPILRDHDASHRDSRVEAWAIYWRSHAAVQSVGYDAGDTYFVLDGGRVLGESTARSWPGAFMESFANAINHGIDREGLGDAFGSLSVDGSLLVHRLCGKEAAALNHDAMSEDR